MSTNCLEERIRKRLGRIVSAVSLLHEDINAIALRAQIKPTPSIGIATLEVHTLRRIKVIAQFKNYWIKAPSSLHSDIEAAFFQKEFSRPALRRQGLFANSRETIETEEIHPDRQSAHARIAAHGELKSLGVDWIM